jgi:hypothetical protein
MTMLHIFARDYWDMNMIKINDRFSESNLHDIEFWNDFFRYSSQRIH